MSREQLKLLIAFIKMHHQHPTHGWSLRLAELEKRLLDSAG